MHPQQQHQNSSQQFIRSMNGMLFFARSLAVSAEVFLHDPRTFGERYMNLQVGAALLFMLVYPAFWPEHDASPMLGLLVAFLVMCAMVRAGIVDRRRRSDTRPHSYYSGTPWLMRLARGGKETTAKGTVEPMLLWIGGALIGEINAPLGGYLVLAGIGLFISVQTSLAAERRRMLDLNDAAIDQRRVMEQWRGGHRD